MGSQHSSEGDDREVSDADSDSHSGKPFKDSGSRAGLDPGLNPCVVEGSRGISSGSLFKVLQKHQTARLDLPATCTSQQGTFCFLRTSPPCHCTPKTGWVEFRESATVIKVKKDALAMEKFPELEVPKFLRSGTVQEELRKPNS